MTSVTVDKDELEAIMNLAELARKSVCHSDVIGGARMIASVVSRLYTLGSNAPMPTVERCSEPTCERCVSGHITLGPWADVTT